MANKTIQGFTRDDVTGALLVTGIGGGGGSGASTTVQDEGSALPAQTTINFIGPSVTAADDVANARTNITIDPTSLISSAVATHEADTTNVHGIADTSQLALTSNVVRKGNIWIPEYNNLRAANADPASGAVGGSALTAGTSFYTKLRVGNGFTANFGFVYVSTAMVGGTYAHAALKRLDGTLLADTDLINTGPALTSTGMKKIGFSPAFAGALDLPSDSVVYLEILEVGATTAPILLKVSTLNVSAVPNVGLAASDGFRFATAATQTDVTLSPAPSAASSSGVENWAGLSDV